MNAKTQATLMAAKMIQYRVDKGYNFTESCELLEEILDTDSSNSFLPYALQYNDFISMSQRQKMESAA